MKDKWLLILGANSDIAQATARRFAKNGWNLYLASRNIDALEKQAQHLRISTGVHVENKYFDALDYESHSGFYANLEPKPFGVIVSFGVLGDQHSSQNDFSRAKMIIESNYLGAVSILEIIMRDFESKGRGFIVGISSVAGDRGRASNYIYGSAKAGLTAYLSGARHRLYKSGVHVMTVKPGFVDTKMTAEMKLPQKLLASPEGVAEKIYKGVVSKKNTIYIKWMWRYIMLIIRHLPEAIFKKTNL
ncbi:MAG: SDR family oxidoreductase [Desulfuromonas sp.]